MDKRGCFGVLAGILLISVAVGVRDATAVGRLRILMAERGEESSKLGQDAGSPTTPASPLKGRPQTHNHRPVGPGNLGTNVPKDSPPPGIPSNSPSASRAPPNAPAASQMPSPSTPSVSLNPTHPPPAPGGPVNPSPPSSENPSSQSPPPGSPSHVSPASDGHSRPPPPPGIHPVPAGTKLPNPVPGEHGRETPTNGKDGKEKEKKKQTGSSSRPGDSQGKGQENDKCNASMHMCHVEGLIACLQQSQSESQKWSLLVQNEGGNTLTVNILAPSSVTIDKTLTLPQHKTSKIEFHADSAEGLRIVLNAGNGDCILSMPPPSTFNFFQRLPNYANHVTPIYGVYLVSLTVIFAGGTWACCKCRKKSRVDSGVTYQQLEMGAQHQSSALVDENVTNGWDESWNDDWDEEEAAPRPPEKRGSASENGVTFRSSAKNEWEDWDD